MYQFQPPPVSIPFHQRPHPVSMTELMKQSYEMYGFVSNDIIEKMRNAARLQVGQVSRLLVYRIVPI